jgi:4-amino-4-deoxy-L-arabinose transferase-like glycosyltransferase
MAEGGDWLTPYFLGRYALYKPPFLYWMSAAGIRTFGPSNTALRLPSWAAGVVTAVVVFAWVWRSAPLASAVASTLLLLSSHLFFVLSRIALTDALLVCQFTLAMFAVQRDPRLARGGSLLIFGLACGAAILTKAAAGLLPLLAASGFWLISPARPELKRLLQLAGLVVLVALPWHAFHLWTHPRWFWAEYVLQEHLSWGLSPLGQTSDESPVGFYFGRLLQMDPVLPVLGTGALCLLRSRLLGVWLAVVLAAIFAFQYRNVAYLLPLLPALAVLTGLAIPARWSRSFLLAAVALACVKAAAGPRPWGLPFQPENVNPSHAALDRYAALGRATSLILLDADDQFYAPLLHVPSVRYAYMGESSRHLEPLDFSYLGIELTAPEFNASLAMLAAYGERLRQFGLASTRPVGSTIWVRDPVELSALLGANTGLDFYVPAQWESLAPKTHRYMPGPPGRAFLLALQPPR